MTIKMYHKIVQSYFFMVTKYCCPVITARTKGRRPKGKSSANEIPNHF